MKPFLHTPGTEEHYGPVIWVHTQALQRLKPIHEMMCMCRTAREVALKIWRKRIQEVEVEDYDNKNKRRGGR